MSLLRLSCGLPSPDLSILSLFSPSRGHLYPAWERQEEPSHLWPVYHFKVCVSAKVPKAEMKYINIHRAEYHQVQRKHFYKDMTSGQPKLAVIRAGCVCKHPWICYGLGLF